MEFRSSSNGRFGFAGYSQFRTGGSGAYEGNLLISDAAIERNLLEYIPVEEIYKLRDRLEQELSLRFGTIYNGYLVVDMMICRFPESPVYRIHPCVEINLRMNMGVVARHIYDHYIYPTSTGAFQISYYPYGRNSLESTQRMEEAYPLEIEQGRINQAICHWCRLIKRVVIGRGVFISKSVFFVILYRSYGFSV